MGDPTKGRKNPRAQVSLVARYRSPTAFEFVSEECFDLSAGGMFIKSPAPAPAGTLIKLECDVNGGAQVIRGVARVVWQRESEAEGQPPGMGVKFVKLDAGGREIIAGILKELGAEATASAHGSVPPSPIAPKALAEPAPRDPEPQRASAAIVAAAAPTGTSPSEPPAPPQAPTSVASPVSSEPPHPASPSSSGRPEARELRERLERAKTLPDHGPTPARARDDDDPATRPTPLEMPRPPEVLAAIAAAAEREAETKTSKAKAEPAKDAPVSGGTSKPPARPSQATVSPRASAAPSGTRTSTSTRPAPASGKPIGIGLSALALVMVLYATMRPRTELSRPAESDPEMTATAEPAAPPPAPAKPEVKPEPAAAEPAQPALPPSYVLEVSTYPEGARVVAGEQSIVTPGTIELGALEAPIELRADKEGYATARATIDRVGFMLDDGRMRRRVVLALSEVPKAAPPVEAPPTAKPIEQPKPPASAKAPEARKPEGRASAASAKPAAAKKAAVVHEASVAPEPANAPADTKATVAAQEKPAKAAPEPASAPGASAPKQTPMQLATACLAQSDNACVVQALEGKAKSPQELELLIETYRAMGKADLAEKQMQLYVEKFPGERRATAYQRLIERRKEAAAEAAAPQAAP